MGDVKLTLHFKHVKKSFPVPSQRLNELLNVYITLTQLGILDAIRCRSFKVNRLCMCGFTCQLKES